VWALREQDWATVTAAVHPERGVRFSPYTYVRTGQNDGADLLFGAEELSALVTEPAAYVWGRYDGSGEPIALPFADYYARFVYDADFAWAYAVGYDRTVGSGNTINNLSDVYPEAHVVEFYMAGSDPQVAGLDWRSLRLVLEKVGETWYLVGVVHDEWTI
jgi:hypothetical protein